MSFEKSVHFALKLEVVLSFEKLQEANYVFKMAASIGLLEVSILIFGFLYLVYILDPNVI